ncbi:MAG: LacI family DNA-binding transcriptional regulator [Catenulispora sp.]|nr:LacI family DNA-binding transcriptional regulator [Catenulispora sp.]
MADVARLAGVSYQTVSRVLNDLPHVRASTRARVLAAIRESGYRPNAAARTLVTGRSHTLGVVAVDTVFFGPASTLAGIERAARDTDYAINIVTPRTPDGDSVLEAVDRLRNQAVAGVIVIAPRDSVAGVLARAAAGVSLVGAGCGRIEQVGGVAVDQRAGAALATRYLLDLGHRTVHHVAGPAGWLDAAGRAEGWRAELKRVGAAIPPPLTGDWSARSGYTAGRTLARDPAVTAVFCANDHMALGLLRAFHEAGRQVPSEVSVIGFDDIPGSPYFAPPLSTIRQNFGELGRSTLQLLVEQLQAGTPVPRRVLIAPDLIVRSSTRPPAPARGGRPGRRRPPPRPRRDG